MINERYYTVDEVASRLCLHRNTVEKWIAQGRLRAFKLGKRYMIPREALDACFEPLQGLEAA